MVRIDFQLMGMIYRVSKRVSYILLDLSKIGRFLDHSVSVMVIAADT